MSTKKIQTFGRKRNAIAVATCTEGTGMIKCNGVPLDLIEPAELRIKAFEPLLLAKNWVCKFDNLDIRVKVTGGGHVTQIYAVRQALAKALVAWYQKYVDEASKIEIRDMLLSFDRSILISDPRRCESKKFNGRGARARRQKSYR